MTFETQTPQAAAPPKAVLCPYCGDVSEDTNRCSHCRGLFEPLSRQASQNAMGPWCIRDPSHPFLPGCSFDMLRIMVKRERVTANTVIRGPSTRQFWMFAKRAPTVANLLGVCHNCQAAVRPEDAECPYCHADFRPDLDRQHLGLAEVRLLPGQATPEAIAAASAQAAGRGVLTQPVARPASPVSPTSAQQKNGVLVFAVVLLGVVAALLLAALTIVIVRPDLISGRQAVEPTLTDRSEAPAKPVPSQTSSDPTPPQPESDVITPTSPGDGNQTQPDQVPEEPAINVPENGDRPAWKSSHTRIAAMLRDADSSAVHTGLRLLAEDQGQEIPEVERAWLASLGKIRAELLALSDLP